MPDGVFGSREKWSGVQGRSAGGLTMGAVLNMRPDLFNAAIMGVPFVDVVTTMMDESIPLTNIEWEEWGNPTVSHVLLGSLPAGLLGLAVCLNVCCIDCFGVSVCWCLIVFSHRKLLVFLTRPLLSPWSCKYHSLPC